MNTTKFVITKFTDDLNCKWTFSRRNPEDGILYVRLDDPQGTHYGKFMSTKINYGRFVERPKFRRVSVQYLRDDKEPNLIVLDGVQQTANNPEFNQNYLENIICR